MGEGEKGGKERRGGGGSKGREIGGEGGRMRATALRRLFHASRLRLLVLQESERAERAQRKRAK